jgi:hypothetical protein
VQRWQPGPTFRGRGLTILFNGEVRPAGFGKNHGLAKLGFPAEQTIHFVFDDTVTLTDV